MKYSVIYRKSFFFFYCDHLGLFQSDFSSFSWALMYLLRLCMDCNNSYWQGCLINNGGCNHRWEGIEWCNMTLLLAFFLSWQLVSKVLGNIWSSLIINKAIITPGKKTPYVLVHDRLVGILVSLQAVCQYVNFINDTFLRTVRLYQV